MDYLIISGSSQPALIVNLLVNKLQDMGFLPSKSVDMSKVSEQLAESLLRSLGIKIRAGENKDLLKSSGSHDFSHFDMSQYQDEKAATGPYCKYLEKSLTALMVDMSEYEVVDLRPKKMSLPGPESIKFNGYLDVGLVPAKSKSFLDDMIVAVELKHRTDHKERFKARQAGTEAKANLGLTTKWNGKVKGQSCIELLAACSICELPLQLLLTDGDVSHILKLYGKNIIVWEDLDPRLALEHIAESINKKVNQDADEKKEFAISKNLLASPRLAPSLLSINGEAAGPSVHSSSLEDQLDSVLPWYETKGERLEVALELIQEHVRHQQGFSQWPSEFQRMYV